MLKSLNLPTVTSQKKQERTQPRPNVEQSTVTSQLTGTEIALCGATAGVVSRLVIAPLDVLKIRLQLQTHRNGIDLAFAKRLRGEIDTRKYRGIIHGLRVIVREEGIRALWKGNLCALYLYLSYGAIQFSSYKGIESLLDQFSEKHISISPTVKSFLCGAMAGSIATAGTYPFDLLRTRFAMQGERKVYAGMMQAFKEIYKHEGIGGFYRGVVPSIIQIMPYMGLMFGSYDAFKRGFLWLERNNMWPESFHSMEDATCGALSGLISKLGVFPVDVIRKRLQIQGPTRSNYILPNLPRYSKSMIRCMRQIVRREGVLALYKGVTPGLIKAVPTSAVTFAVFGAMKNLLEAVK
ncbi:uncharacterized protein VTP21DRAFT_1606 [Calcarisporiella thermophila]|uniref:uncharacterized protein n=1 Tax=Calcarisporiella thermophila TaxID=911321 RepID=UPI003743B16E